MILHKRLLLAALSRTTTTMKNTNYELTFLLVVLCFLTTSARGQQQQQLGYSPADDITIDCGHSGKSTTRGNLRSWDGDIDSKYFQLDVAGNRNSVTRDVGVEESSWLRSKEPVPYNTARLSNSTFTYIIPVTPGPKFLRLYFSAYSYQGFNSSAGFFSVGVGRYTLLSNFSAYLAAGPQDDENAGVRREFLLTPEGSSLNVTFTPSPSVPNGFAFVSGIEVVSMPSELYYSADRRVLMVGEENSYYTLQNSTALETMYRINVGGSVIPPDKDTGMFREWDGEDDYLSIPGPSVLPQSVSEPLRFRSNLSSYAAPATVYSTARSTGDASHTKEEIRAYNLTWEFPVDSGFAYLIRLHFCEIQSEVTRQGDRVFNIFIDGRFAERNFDVLANVDGRYVPYFRDYVIFKLGGEQGKRINLSVALQANPVDADSAYIDAILNGLEIFKLSNTTGSLAGPNPDPRAVSVPTEPTAGKRKDRTAMIAGVASGVIFLLGLIGLFVTWRSKRIRDSGGSDKASWWGPISLATTAKSTKSRGSTTLPSELCRHFSLAEIKAATNNFDDLFIIGVGGFGNVYKGYIDSGATAVAIKRLKSESSQGAREFTTEIEMLSHLRHRHLVSLIGYCDDRGEMILVYEYMSRGTLRDHLYKSDNPPMTWRRRLEACVGAARGLHYLHTGAKLTVIHRDVKTTNILLDDAFVAKVSDFGLSKTGPTTTSKGHVTTVVKGSIGYLDPEYYRRQQLSEKSDVYSFGVVLCEVLAGRPPILRTAAERRQVSLAEWARSCHRNGTLSEIVDPNLAGKIAPECLKKYGEIAISCMLDDGADRPSMNDVVWGLEFAIQLQQNSDESGGVAVKGKEETALIDGVSDTDGTFSCSWDDSSRMRSSGATKFSSTENGSSTGDSMKVFSEIYDPKAR